MIGESLFPLIKIALRNQLRSGRRLGDRFLPTPDRPRREVEIPYGDRNLFYRFGFEVDGLYFDAEGDPQTVTVRTKYTIPNAFYFRNYLAPESLQVSYEAGGGEHNISQIQQGVADLMCQTVIALAAPKGHGVTDHGHTPLVPVPPAGFEAVRWMNQDGTTVAAHVGFGFNLRVDRQDGSSMKGVRVKYAAVSGKLDDANALRTDGEDFFPGIPEVEGEPPFIGILWTVPG